MSYEIIIREKINVRKLGSEPYQVIGQEEDGTNKYGYPPDREKYVTEERDVLKQTVDTLDLPAVIKAINKL